MLKILIEYHNDGIRVERYVNRLDGFQQSSKAIIFDNLGLWLK